MLPQMVTSCNSILQSDLGYPATSLSGYLYYPAVILQCVLSSLHAFPHKLLLKNQNKW